MINFTGSTIAKLWLLNKIRNHMMLQNCAR